VVLSVSAAGTGCAEPGLLTASPGELAWGEIDFTGWPADMPEGGYDPVQIVLTNSGEGEIEVTLAGFDFERLCLAGYSTVPTDLPTIAPGSTWLFDLGVCAYISEEGDRGTTVRGEIGLETNGENGVLVIPWSFMPVVQVR